MGNILKENKELSDTVFGLLAEGMTPEDISTYLESNLHITLPPSLIAELEDSNKELFDERLAYFKKKHAEKKIYDIASTLHDKVIMMNEMLIYLDAKIKGEVGSDEATGDDMRLYKDLLKISVNIADTTIRKQKADQPVQQVNQGTNIGNINVFSLVQGITSKLDKETMDKIESAKRLLPPTIDITPKKGKKNKTNK